MKNISLLSSIAFFFFMVFSSLSYGQTYDVAIDSMYMINGEFTITPLHHTDSFRFGAYVKNEGSSTTAAKLKMYNSSFSDSVSISAMDSGNSDFGLSTKAFLPLSVGDYSMVYEAIITETDSDLSNNKDSIEFEISDTVYAKEYGKRIVNGIGFNAGAGTIGQRFHLKVADTVTSISVFINTPVAGDSVKAHLYSFTGVPGSIIESSETIVMTAGTNWYTVPLICPAIVSAGDYFVGIEQLMQNTNMGLAYTFDNFTDSSAFYNGGAGWVVINNSIGFPITLFIRMNLGYYDTYREVNISSGADSICEGVLVSLQGDKDAKYSWAPASKAFSPTGRNTLFNLTESTQITVIADFGCGLTARDTIDITLIPSPKAVVSPDDTICRGDSITLTASGGTSYSWLNGPSNSDWTVTPTTSPTPYTLRVDTSSGCFSGYSINIYLSEPSIDAIGDTAICLGQKATISATGTPSVIWDNGDTSKTRTINPSQTTYRYVTGIDEFGCTDSDSVLVTILETPLLTPMTDTGGCFGRNTTITAGGEADNYAWSNGDTTKSTTFKVTKNITLYVLASNDSGCEDSDTVEVARYIKPNGFTDNDTTICEGTSVSLQAYGGASYEWSNSETTESITVAPIEQTKYDVIIRSLEGCEDYDDITVSISPLPVPDFSFSKVEGKVTFVNLSVFTDSYSWDFGDTKSSTDKNPINEYDTTGTYTVRLTATNQCGSVDSSQNVTVFVPKEVNNINGIGKWNNLDLYPVPSYGLLNYAINNHLYGNMSISVISITGEVLYEENTIKSQDNLSGYLDLSSYSNGVYFVQFSIEGSTIRSKVVKH